MTSTDLTSAENVIPIEQMRELLLRAQEGDLTCLAELRTLLDSRPDLWKQVGNLAAHAELVMLRLVGGNNLHIQEAVRRKLHELKTELAGPSPTPLEKLLVERVGVCWLQVHQLDLQAAAGLAATPTAQGVQAQKRIDSGHRRYLLAIKQLATIRKLLKPDLPALQVSVYAARTPSKAGRPRKQSAETTTGQQS